MTAAFSFTTEWRFDAPHEMVCDAIIQCLDWPQWWLGAEQVEKLITGDSDGVGSVHRFTWKGKIPYHFTFTMRVTRYVPGVLLEGGAEGEVVGTGRWDFVRANDITIVRYAWTVRTNRLWMNLLAPIARPIFKWNHDQVMRQGELGLAHWLRMQSK
ncbi:MAG: SRPBCC family protein [Nitrosomonas sp.]|nr:SRPBCC family protein [Nitrosomonas sp.]